jgi:hypothetical protein
MTAKKKTDAPELSLTAEQQQELAGAGIDWRQVLEALRNSPAFKMMLQLLLDAILNPQPQPVYTAGHDPKANLDAALRSAVCTAHCIACCCHDHE